MSAIRSSPSSDTDAGPSTSISTRSGVRSYSSMSGECTEDKPWQHWLARYRVRRRQTVAGVPQPVFKILFIGDQCTGKTSIVQRLAYDRLPDLPKPTIGADYAACTINWSVNTSVRLHLWDISGQDRFQAMTRPFYRHADAACVVYDISRPETLQSAAHWKEQLDQLVRLPCGARIPCLLLGNKCDLDARRVFGESKQYMEGWARKHQFQGWFETSATESIGLDYAMENLLLNLMDGAVHRRVDDERDKQQLVNGEEACACMADPGPVEPVGPRIHTGTVWLPTGCRADSGCCCW